MALIVNQNLFALNSQNKLASSQNALGKSIERLSSGLRINHAADDASGMAISEKMRGQISGLKRASMNAQDGISYLQTAEGAMEQVSSILQRMRELAVQASNGIYTTNDRAEIQKEVDQLKEEIDRISTATEFNTRKLINGDATALWSTDTNLMSAIIRSDVAEGNYEVTMSVRPGTNHILKSHIMSLNEDAMGAEIIDPASNDTNVGDVSNPSGNLDPTGTAYYTVDVEGSKVSGAPVDSDAALTGTYQDTGSSWAVTIDPTSATTHTDAGYYEIEFLESSTDGNTVAFRYRFINAMTGEVSDWTEDTTDAVGSYTLNNGSDDVFDFNLTLSATGKITSGDKFLVAVSPTYDEIETGGGTIQISDGPNGGNNPKIVYSAQSSLTPDDNGDSTLDTNDVDVWIASLDPKTGNLNLGSITLNFKETQGTGGNVGDTTAGSFTLAIRGGGEAATTTTKLKDIANFTNADGTSIFLTAQELTIYGNGTSTTVFIEGNDTIATLMEKLTKAIVDDLQMGSEDPQVNNNLVRYITQPDPSGWGTVAGTFLMQTAMTGEQGQLSFIGQQSLIDALGLATVQEATNNETSVEIRDAHTGALIGRETTGTDRVFTLVKGVELVLDSRAGVLSSWDPTTNSLLFEGDINMANKKMYLHLVDSRSILQIGSNRGQSLNVSIPQLDLAGLNLENLTMVSQDRAERAITQIDEALTKVVTARATVGAQISRLEYTIDNLATARENLTASESRIRDLDVAEESTNYTSAQILSQSGIAMLAQANQLQQMALQLIQA